MTTYTTSEVAEKFDTTPRDLRKFLRDDAANREVPNPGKGARWTIEARDLRSLNSRFKKWSASQDEARTARAEAKDATDEIAAEVDSDEVEDFDSLENPLDA